MSEYAVSPFNTVFSVDDITRLILASLNIESIFRFSMTCRAFTGKDWLVTHCDFISLASTLDMNTCKTMVWMYNKNEVVLPGLVITDHNIDSKQNNYAYSLVVFYLWAFYRQERCFFSVMTCLDGKVEYNDEIYRMETLNLLEDYEKAHEPYESIVWEGATSAPAHLFEVIFNRNTGNVDMLITTTELQWFTRTSQISDSIVLSHESVHCMIRSQQFREICNTYGYRKALPILKEKFRLGCLEDASRYEFAARKFSDLMDSLIQ